jgi:phosphoglycerate dehydrogenase-like enzyme
VTVTAAVPWRNAAEQLARRLRDRWRYGRPPERAPWAGSGLRILAEAPGSFTAASWHEAFTALSGEVAIDLRVSRHPEERDLLLPDADVYLTGSVSSRILASARRLRLLHVLSAGADAARRMAPRDNLVICTAAGVAARGLAEHALGLMLAFTRQLPGAVLRQRTWTWHAPARERRPLELRGRTVAVLGLGSAGRTLCALLHPFEVELVTWDGRDQPPSPPGGVRSMPTLHAALGGADFVVLCLPDTPATRGLMDGSALAAMKEGAVLINVSRGSLVDHRALAAALRAGHLGGAGLDVLDREPPGRGHPLRGCPNLIITPHIAGNMHAYRKDIQARCVANVRRLAMGEPLLGVLATERESPRD